MATISGLDKLEIEFGDIILVHSSISRLARHLCPESPKTLCGLFYECLVEKVGPEGTLLFPAFNFDFCSGKPFSMRETKSQMGALTSFVLKQPEAIRTKHPVYSFAVVGKLAKLFAEIDNKSAYADDSIFGELKRRNGKIMIVDLPYNHSMTFFHHVEEVENVDYRYHKDFTGDYIDGEGRKSIRTYSIFVRKLELGVETEVEPMGLAFEAAGGVKRVVFDNGSFIKIMNADELFDFTVKNMKQNPRLLYKINKEAVAR